MRIAGGAALVVPVTLALVTASPASPQFTTTYALTYSSQVPSSPSGLDATVRWSDPGEPFGKPKEIQKIKLIFHPGTRLDTSALPLCKASDRTVQLRGLRACPASTRLGSVKGEGIVSVGQRFDPVATLFNARRAMIVVVTLGDRFLVNFRDDVRRRSITINFKIPKGVALTGFQPHVPAHLRKRGKRRKAYMRTPAVCPASGVWGTAAIFTYRDGSVQELSATTPCKRS